MFGRSKTECPPVVRDAICDILYTAALAIRAAGVAGDAKYCSVEAGHVHNLPSLLKSYDRERLRYYLEVEVPDYIDRLARIPNTNTEAYSPHWERLREHYAKDGAH
jgi:hypothetical protein